MLPVPPLGISIALLVEPTLQPAGAPVGADIKARAGDRRLGGPALGVVADLLAAEHRVADDQAQRVADIERMTEREGVARVEPRAVVHKCAAADRHLIEMVLPLSEPVSTPIWKPEIVTPVRFNVLALLACSRIAELLPPSIAEIPDPEPGTPTMPMPGVPMIDRLLTLSGEVVVSTPFSLLGGWLACSVSPLPLIVVSAANTAKACVSVKVVPVIRLNV